MVHPLHALLIQSALEATNNISRLSPAVVAWLRRGRGACGSSSGRRCGAGGALRCANEALAHGRGVAFCCAGGWEARRRC